MDYAWIHACWHFVCFSSSIFTPSPWSWIYFVYKMCTQTALIYGSRTSQKNTCFVSSWIQVDKYVSVGWQPSLYVSLIVVTRKEKTLRLYLTSFSWANGCQGKVGVPCLDIWDVVQCCKTNCLLEWNRGEGEMKERWR